MKKKNSKKNKNYKDEVIPVMGNDICEQLRKITERLGSNIDEGKYLDCWQVMKNISTPGYLKNSLIALVGQDYNGRTSKAKVNNDFKGIYLFVKGETPVYVGISRRACERIRGHFARNSKNSSSWIYAMLKEKVGADEVSSWDQQRLSNEIKEYRTEYFEDLRLTACLVHDSYILHMAEAFAAVQFKTKWNSFKTH